MRHQVAEYLVHDYLLTINCSPAAELWVFAGALNEGLILVESALI